MNCFVIMPFDEDFDDVYGVIKQTVEAVTLEKGGRCFRLDESRPAGRITDRLLGELRSAALCVADVTGTNPNVMWELGFAMALDIPVIVIAQNLKDLSFDIRDMQTIEYRRNHLAGSLNRPLRRVIVDTLAAMQPSKRTSGPSNQQDETIGALRSEIAELKNIVSEVVTTWKGVGIEPGSTGADYERQGMLGNWITSESGSHAYSRVVRGELVTPYCFMGNDDLTGIYFGWRRIGDYWFARYRWLDKEISGFTFLKRDSADVMTGSWWSSDHEIDGVDGPPKYSGVPATWIRQTDIDVPEWAEEVFSAVESEGLAGYFARTDAIWFGIKEDEKE